MFLLLLFVDRRMPQNRRHASDLPVREEAILVHIMDVPAQTGQGHDLLDAILIAVVFRRKDRNGADGNVLDPIPLQQGVYHTCIGGIGLQRVGEATHRIPREHTPVALKRIFHKAALRTGGDEQNAAAIDHEVLYTAHHHAVPRAERNAHVMKNGQSAIVYGQHSPHGIAQFGVVRHLLQQNHGAQASEQAYDQIQNQ